MSGREYMEVTLHMKGGGQVVFAAERFSTKRSTVGDGYTGFEWTHAAGDDLPQLHSADLPNLTAITTVQIREES